MKTISLTVPMDPSVLTQTATYLRLMASTITPNARVADASDDVADAPDDVAAPITEEFMAGVLITPPESPAPQATDVFTAPVVMGGPVAPAVEALVTAPAPVQAAEVFTHPLVTGGPVAETPAPAPTPAPEAPAGVELDCDGLPHDMRIHAGTKTFVKKTGQWKKKRGVEAELVTQVEAELKAAMAAPAPTAMPEAPTTPTNTPAAPAPAPVPPAPVTVSAAPAPVAAPAPTAIDPKSITNFAEFMSACTANEVPAESIVAACQQHGIAAPTLLAARPDLVLAVAKTLFGAA